jgi:hypothetical protein
MGEIFDACKDEEGDPLLPLIDIGCLNLIRKDQGNTTLAFDLWKVFPTGCVFRTFK